MHSFRVLMQPSVLRFSTLFLAAIVLVPFDTPKTALAQPEPPEPPGEISFLPGSAKCDYPTDNGIASVFLCTEPYEALLTVNVPDTLGREQAQGWAWVLSNAEGPSVGAPECGVWFRYQFPALRANPAVQGIFIVNINDFADQWKYWERGDGDAARERPRRDDGGNGNGNSGNGRGGSSMNAVVPAVTSLGGWLNGGVGAGAAALGTLRALTEHPFGSTGDDTKSQQDQPEGVKTDVLPNSNTAELPDLPVGIDQNPIKVGLLNSDIGEFSNVPIGISQYPTDVAATDSTSPDIQRFDLGGGSTSYANWRNSNPATSLKLFGRRRRMVQTRGIFDLCSIYWVDASDPDYPRDEIAPEALNINVPAASSLGPLYHWVDGDRATVKITQHKRSSDSPGQPYYLDINILGPNSRLLLSQPRAVAPPSREIEINTQGRLPLSLRVTVDEVKNNPISFRYGNPHFPNWSGTEWKSNEVQEHGCVTDPTGNWDASRNILCLFKV
ncbi:hypothetical protein MMC07_001712 [Pseudocyphellaria aurata]|nr:hypothetical protein [Pseudocyphellaria aurata]